MRGRTQETKWTAWNTKAVKHPCRILKALMISADDYRSPLACELYLMVALSKLCHPSLYPQCPGTITDS